MTILHTVRNLPAMKAREGIPPAKRRAQLTKTLAGSAVFVGGFLLPLLGYPWYAGVGVAFFGGFIVSQQFVLDFAKAVAQFVQAIGGKTPSEPPVDGRGAKVDE